MSAVKLECTNYCSADIDEVWCWKPTSPEEVCFQFEFEISEVGKEGGTYFQTLVATPEGLRNVIRTHQGFEIPNRGLLLFDSYSWESLIARIKGILEKCSGSTWADCMTYLQRYFLWEYEDYRTDDDG